MSTTDSKIILPTNQNVNNNTRQTKIYRYKFSSDILSRMKPFAKIHSMDDSNTFKEAWDIWLRKNANAVQQEITRLTNLGHVGDILLKMYKSSRYYYAKQSNKNKTPNKRRVYITIDQSILGKMDTHIKTNASTPTYKPSRGFTNFMEEYYYEIRSEYEKIQNTHKLSTEDTTDKFKKTYKNRYYTYNCASRQH